MSFPIRCRAWRTNARRTCTSHTCARAAPRKLYAVLLGLANTCIEAPTCRAGRVLCVPMKPGARLSRRATKWYWRLHRGACRGCVSRPPPGMQQGVRAYLILTRCMHGSSRTPPRNISVGGSRGSRGGRASASGRERRGHSRTRAHFKSLVCYVGPPGAATGHRCRPATPPQRQRASTARITLVSCASSSTRNACLSSSTNKHSVSVTQAMRQLRAHYKHQHFPCKEGSPFRNACKRCKEATQVHVLSDSAGARRVTCRTVRTDSLHIVEGVSACHARAAPTGSTAGPGAPPCSFEAPA